ncbi:hypothetical protein C0583_02385 [Candidatus Parcubacteria bacterium]|nr:MAG: hypothetical protein C0583_02385 [Candidatus Parcubacteria bacterium]
MKNYKSTLAISFVTVFVFVVSVAVLSPFGSYVMAYLNSYEKSSGDLLSVEMWNNLDDDFGKISGDCRVVSGETYAQEMTLSCDADETVINHSMIRRNDSGCDIRAYVGDSVRDERTVWFSIEDVNCGIRAKLICCDI